MKQDNYKDSLTEAMTLLGKHPDTVFVGQTVIYGGQAMFPTMAGVPLEKRIEFPVAEDFQMGFCIGLSMAGFIPIAIYPRWDFLILASNQLVNHLDKIHLMGGFDPKVIIRVGIGPKTPLNAGEQHTQDHTQAFRLMLKTVKVVRIENNALDCYLEALESKSSTIVVEEMERY